MLSGVVDPDSHPGFHWAVDLAVIIASIVGIATTLGFSSQTMAAIPSGVFGLEAQILTYDSFALIGAVFLTDVWLGNMMRLMLYTDPMSAGNWAAS
jgi:glycine betaine transporter